MCPTPSPSALPLEAIVVVDPMSTGARISIGAYDRGYAVIRLWSSECPPALRAHIAHGVREVFAHTFEHEGGSATDALEATATTLRALPYTVVAVICGSEPGVTLTDALSEHMGMRGNSTQLAHVRRNKFNQSEAVRSAGARAVEQALVASVHEALAFLPSLKASPFRAIVKPVESAGSEDVKLCTSADEVAAHVRSVLGTNNALGQLNDTVLVQEYLQGVEYIIDCVTRDGVHKFVAVWAYDKRPVNGAAFVYFGQRPMSVDNPIVSTLIAYVTQVLDALGITNGATHSEVIVDAAGAPCLVECNCRSHGGNGEWIDTADALMGYSQVTALLDAYVNPAGFDALPAAPQPFNGTGMLVFLPSYKAGVLLAVPGLERLATLSSFVRSALEVHIGDRIIKTINVFTEVGIAVLLNDDVAACDADYERLHEL
jgi:biotin carboxylase